MRNTASARPQTARNYSLWILLLGASPLVTQAAFAQEVPASTPRSETSELEEVVVVGLRASLEKSLAQKRKSNAIVDVITAEDVGKFPDKNVADALQRVPGVVIERDGGEGARVSIRGLSSDLTLTQLNGNFIASIESVDGLNGSSNDPSRSFNYLMLPSALIGSVETYKSSEAKLDDGGVGGTVILRTRRPLDLESWSGFLSAEVTDSDVTRKREPQFAGQLSWRDEAQTLGALVGVTSQKRTNRRLGMFTESWRWWTDDSTQPPTDTAGNVIAPGTSNFRGVTDGANSRSGGFWAPTAVFGSIRDEERERLGIQTTGQWKPADDLMLTANYFRFQLNNNYQTYEVGIPEWMLTQGDFDDGIGGNCCAGERRNGLVTNGLTFDGAGTILTGAQFALDPDGAGPRQPATLFQYPQIRGVYSRQKTISNTYDLQAEFNRDNFSLSLKTGYTEASGGPTEQFRAAYYNFDFPYADPNSNAATAASWNLSSRQLNFSDDLIDRLQSGIGGANDNGSTLSEYFASEIDERYVQVDGEFKIGYSFLESIDVGIKHRDGSIVRQRFTDNYYLPDTTTRYQDAGGAPPGSVAILDHSIGNITGGFGANVFPGIDWAAFRGYLQDQYGDPVHTEEQDFRYGIREELLAGYVQANYKWNTVRGNVGVRVVNTMQSGESPSRITYFLDFVRVRGDITTILPLDQQQRVVNVSLPQDKNYVDVLPSFNLTWEARSDLLMRLAASKVISRPGYNSIGAAQELSFFTDEYVADRTGLVRPGWFGGGGNRDLDPFQARQYDLGLEWYFARGAVGGLTLFRKDVSSFIVPLVIPTRRDVPPLSTGTVTIPGGEVAVQEYSTVANGTDARSQGVEVFGQYQLSWGLGFFGNFTYNDTNVAEVSLDGQTVGKSPLVGSAKTQINASTFYESGGLLLRASYNRRGSRVGGLVSGFTQYTRPYQQVDLNAAYNFTPNFNLTASVINLTREEEIAQLGSDTSARLVSDIYTGRRFYAGVSYKF